MIKTAVTILFVCLFVSCSRPSIEEGKIVVRPNIVNNTVYKQLDKQKDLPRIGDVDFLPKTSDVSYINDRGGNLDTSYAKFNNCKPYIKDGKLLIDVGRSDGYTGEGFEIKCDSNKFKIIPYYSTDVIIEGEETVSSYNVIQHKLILNKSKYTLGDSIYGYVDFRLTEKTTHNYWGIFRITSSQKITHIGKGYFRGKIEKQP